MIKVFKREMYISMYEYKVQYGRREQLLPFQKWSAVVLPLFPTASKQQLEAEAYTSS